MGTDVSELQNAVNSINTSELAGKCDRPCIRIVRDYISFTNADREFPDGSGLPYEKCNVVTIRQQRPQIVIENRKPVTITAVLATEDGEPTSC